MIGRGREHTLVQIHLRLGADVELLVPEAMHGSPTASPSSGSGANPPHSSQF